jgi:hypothetical protein
MPFLLCCSFVCHYVLCHLAAGAHLYLELRSQLVNMGCLPCCSSVYAVLCSSTFQLVPHPELELNLEPYTLWLACQHAMLIAVIDATDSGLPDFSTERVGLINPANVDSCDEPGQLRMTHQGPYCLLCGSLQSLQGSLPSIAPG